MKDLLYNERNVEFRRGERVALLNKDNLERIFLDNVDCEKIKKNDFSELSFEEIHLLLAKGFILEKGKKIIHKEEREPLKCGNLKCDYIRLILTEKCNLACQYCFVDKSKKDFAEENIKDLCKFVKQNCEQNVELQFFGGEPLICFDIIAKCIQRLEEECSSHKFSYIITTNGTLINKEIATVFKKHNFKVYISIDGNKKMHDAYRKYRNGNGSYVNTVEGINYLKELGVNVSALITYNQFNSHFLADAVEHIICNLGLLQVALNTPQPTEDGWEVNGKEFAKDLIRALRMAKKCGGKLYSVADKVLYALRTKHVQKNSCSRGKNNYSVAITPDFKISFCNVCWKEDVLQDNKCDIEKKISEWKKIGETEDNSHCANCPAKSICGGYCPVEKYFAKNAKKEERKINQKCIFYNELLKWAIWI